MKTNHLTASQFYNNGDGVRRYDAYLGGGSGAEARTFEIAHGSSLPAIVQILDRMGRVVEADIVSMPNRVTITFAAPPTESYHAVIIA